MPCASMVAEQRDQMPLSHADSMPRSHASHACAQLCCRNSTDTRLVHAMNTDNATLEPNGRVKAIAAVRCLKYLRTEVNSSRNALREHSELAVGPATSKSTQFRSTDHKSVLCLLLVCCFQAFALAAF
jgi:hypothetical protein